MAAEKAKIQEKAKMTPEIKLLHQNFNMGHRAGRATEKARWQKKVAKLQETIAKLKAKKK